MLVRGIGEHAGAQGHGRAVRRREVACGGIAQRRFVGHARLSLEIVRVDLLLKVMVETDLESWHVVLREAVISSLWDHEIEHRKSLRSEERRRQGREPA